MLGLLAKAFFVDVFIESINTLKVCTVISRNPDEVLRFIVTVLHRTATVRKEWGGFSGREERVLVTVLSRREATKLRNQLRRSDPSAFITIVNSSEIIGRGFRGV